ncbi:integrator complex subunit 6 isoform X2 [Drosophila innubila]|uniref:integrator complex subunit 6 isoform X2 n=1 Tax=Drosophila innubila TaxID=198719 RepID=UPI00148B6093|nr:integrator complex subunit 6 isoform X2 [Drosophila innubila]
MTIILFLVDTSSSMCQKAYVNGVQKTYLDIAKGAVETFLKYRQRTQDCLGDRYMLLTFEEPPANVKAGWKENHATFMNELKNLQSHGLTSMGESLRNAFDLLNLNRMQSGIDTYGQGRCPFYLEPSVIIVITDGGRYSHRNGVHQEIILPLSNQIPGTKFTKEPFRWDQRLFSLVLRMPGNKIDERVDGKVPHDDSPIERMCEVTGGRSYRVRSHYVLNQCIESLVQKVQPGVVLQFEPMLPKESSSGSSSSSSSSTAGTGGSTVGAAVGGGAGGSGGGGGRGGSTATASNEPTPDIVFQPIKKMIYVQKHITQKTFPIGYWPLPEPYWPDSKAITLPPRDAHPKLKILTPAVDEPQLVRSFPVDKYEIEGCPLTLQILNKREMNKCWQVIVSNGMHGFELPFGYLKAAPNFTQVHLYVLAYNYPALLPLLHDLIHKYNMSPPNDLMYKFNAYVRSIPPYYCPFLRKALVNINVPYQLLQFLLPENVDNYLSPTIANQLKHIKNTAKQDQENLCLKVYKQLKQPKPPYRQVETAKLCTGAALRRDLVRHPLLRDTFAKLHAEIEPVENYTIVVPQLTHQSSAKTYRNPFDIPRRDLVDEIARMRETFLRPASLVAKDSGHCLPIAEMGNYQEYLKNKDNPLREIEPTNVRQHMFGNPYKKDKHMVMVDEADLSDVAPMKSPNGNGGGGISPSSSGNGGGGGGNSSSIGPVGAGMSVLMLGGGNGNGGPMGGPNSKKLDGTARGRKRKAGPLPRAFEFRRLSTDSMRSVNSSSSSTVSSTCSSVGLGSVGDLMVDEDSNSSYASSICSDASSISSTSDSGMSIGHGVHTTERLTFDFSEEEASDQETSLNGYVHNFINGISDEANAIEADSNSNSSSSNNNNNNSNNNNNNSSSSNVGGSCNITNSSSNITNSSNSSASNSTSATVAATAISTAARLLPEAVIGTAAISTCTTIAAAAAAASNGTPDSNITSSSSSNITNSSNITGSSNISSSSSNINSIISSSSNIISSNCSSSSISSHVNSNNNNNNCHINNTNDVLYVPLNGLTMQHAAYSSNASPMSTAMDSGMLMMPATATTTISAMSKLATGASAMPPLLLMPNGYGSHHGLPTGGMLSPPAALATTTAVSALTGVGTATGTSSAAVATTTTTTVGAAAPAATTTNSSSIGSSSTTTPTTYFTHNDINDASEISRILQTCHNGNSGSSISNSSISNSSNLGNGIGIGSSSSVLNGNASDGNANDIDTDLSANSFDALKRTAGAIGSSTVANSNPHFYWGSGLNHHISSHTNSNNNGNNTSNNNNNTTTNSNSSSNNNSSNNSHRNFNNSSPKLEPKASPTHNNNGEDAMTSPDRGLTEEQREAARRHNVDLRLQIFRDIRRPGRDYSQLLEHLNLIKGDQEMKSDFIDMCVSESMRFRRHQMVCSIQEWWEQKQQQLEITKS